MEDVINSACKNQGGNEKTSKKKKKRMEGFTEKMAFELGLKG